MKIEGHYYKTTEAMVLIAKLKALIVVKPTLASEELRRAIGLYEWSGATVEAIEAFENENYGDVAMAIYNEMRGL